jgi:ribonuclease R
MHEKKSKKGRKKRNGKPKGNPLREQILEFLTIHKTKEYTPYQIAKRLRVPDPERVIEQLGKLVKSGRLKETSKQRYAMRAPQTEEGSGKLVEGYVDMAKAGFAFIICQDGARDIYVAPGNLRGADDGDLVQVALTGRRAARPEGVVQRVLQRARTQIVGIVRFFSKAPVAVAQNGRRLYEVQVKIPENLIVEEYDRVIVQITHYKEKPRDVMKGVVIRNLGRDHSTDVEMQSILADKGFPLEWSPKIMAQVAAIPGVVLPETGRRDLRGWTTFTIDPYDAKDFDDALSVHRDEKGKLHIGVHIADVSHYVPEGSALDLEARYRGNSVYLVDRVLPMLPEKLSNELCSLRPREDKHCFSVVFALNENYRVTHHWIGKTLIHSDRRFTYEEAQQLIEGQSDPLAEQVQLLNDIAGSHRKRRIAQGAIDFDTEEVKFRLDVAGNPVALEVKERKEAHMLVEEFMLLANRTVAEFIQRKQAQAQRIPFVYRVHDKPDPEKLELFQTYARELGVYLDFSTPAKVAASLNRLAGLARQDPKYKVLQPLGIRAMAKALYSTENIGHYGLGFEHYAHFTSPIRRYADLIVHRILEKNLKTVQREEQEGLERTCLHISNQERKAMEAERASNRYFQVLFMKAHIGEVFEGQVSGMSERGLYVSLGDTHCEGFLPYGAMAGEMSLHSSRMHAHSESGGRKWTFGDKIHVKLVDADLDDRELLLSAEL